MIGFFHGIIYTLSSKNAIDLFFAFCSSVRYYIHKCIHMRMHLVPSSILGAVRFLLLGYLLPFTSPQIFFPFGAYCWLDWLRLALLLYTR